MQQLSVNKARKASQLAGTQSRGFILKKTILDHNSSIDKTQEFMNVKVPVNENKDTIPGVEGIKLNKDEESFIEHQTDDLRMPTMDQMEMDGDMDMDQFYPSQID